MTDKVQRAVEAIILWSQKEIALVKRLRDAEAQIEKVEMAAGQSLLDEGSRAGAADESQPTAAPTTVDDVSRAHSLVATLKAGIKGAQQRRADSVKVKRAEEAAALRKRGAELSLEADVVEQRSAKLLRDLSKLNDILYTDLILKSQPAGELISHGYQKPKSERLRAECAALMAKADALTDPAKLAEPPSSLREFRSEELTTVGVDEVALAVLSSDVLKVPSASEIFDWFAAVEATTPDVAGHARMIDLVWGFDGHIDRETSFIQVPALGRTFAGQFSFSGRPVMESGSDQFRSQPQPKASRW